MTTVVLAILAFVLLGGGGLALIRWRARQRGYEEAKKDAAERALKQAKDAQKIDRVVSGLSDEEVDNELGKDALDAAEHRKP